MRILAPLLRYDYGVRERGDSLEKQCFVPALAAAGAEIHPLWLEDHGYPDDIEGLQRAIESEARRCDPDLIFFILMRNEVTLDTLERLGQRYRTCNWFSDDQWRFQSFTRTVAPKLTFSVTVDKYSLPLYSAIGCRNVILSQWGSVEPPPASPSGPNDEYDVSFVGSRNLVREWYVEELARGGITVSCFGSGWPNGRVSVSQAAAICRHSKISLNLSNSQPRDPAFRHFLWTRARQALAGRADGPGGYLDKVRGTLGPFVRGPQMEKRMEQIKQRNFEIPAWGGFQVSQFALQIDDYFVPGKEIVLFSTVSELVTVVRYFLQNSDEREAIRAAGQVRASSESLTSRMSAILQRISDEAGIVGR
jgi:spore maturation protein CgeB